jgi:hypothetical protein
MPELSNIREVVGWVIGRRVVDVTCGDPPEIPDSDDDDADEITLHLDNGGTVTFHVDERGFSFCDPDRPDADDAES